jgi:putative membrane-bound dehydrogenase-like protein
MHRPLAFVLLLACSLAAHADDGALPVGADGKPLNLDFETGTLQDWSTEGDAFKDQPIKGNTVTPRRDTDKSGHQGEFWYGGYEKHGDKPTGRLTSTAFKVTHPWASYFVGGGRQEGTYVELVQKDTGEVFHRSAGTDREEMRRVVVNLKRFEGKEIFVRIVDTHTGHWGHVNFDDFRFYKDPPTVVAQAQPPLQPGQPRADVVKNSGLTPEKAAAAMTVPEEFTVTLFAGEPDVHQPIGFCIDDRGRLWVAEAFIYPQRNPFPGPLLPAKDKRLGDRILVFEDTDGDGKHDKKTVFLEGLNLVSGIEVGFGGVWIGAAPYLLFIPDRDGDDKPDGPPQVLLDGWGYQDTHETLNAFTWGPDGWLYGCHGVFTHSRVGKPGAADRDRVPINAGVWRYHPTRHVFEVFAEGTSNPWGLDYNDHGDWFVEACVIPHCYHIIQGARYLRQAGQHFNPYTYADLGTIADHLHYVGPNPHGGNNRSDSAGGGHAHVGLMCYLGGTWPEKYRNHLFMGNIHGKRINVDVPKAKGSGYSAGHTPDFLLANDDWAKFINLKYGPDGNVYVIDWYDRQACHHNDPNIWDRTNGRVYKVSQRGTKAVSNVDLRKCSDEELVAYQAHDNDWYVRHARRLLQERSAEPQRAAAIRGLLERVAKPTTAGKHLRHLWALHAAGGLDADRAAALLEDATAPEHVRGWVVQLTLENSPTNPVFLAALARAAHNDSSPVVRRYIASGLQRVPLDRRTDAAAGLLSHAEDVSDFNLPLMYWYAVEPIAARDPLAALDLAAHGKQPLVLQFMARRLATTSTTPEGRALAATLAKVAGAKDLNAVLAILRGMGEGYKGRRGLPQPEGWVTAAERLAAIDHAEVRTLTASLWVTFGNTSALGSLRTTLADAKADATARQAAAARLLAARDPELPSLLLQLLTDPALRSVALRGLAAFADPRSPAAILAVWADLSTAEKRDAIATLASRPTFAQELLAAVEQKKVPAADIPAETVRQLRNLNDAAINAKIATVWGLVRESPAERKKLIAQWAKSLNPATLASADLGAGRAVYNKACGQCHMLYGVGGKVGPEITGANRSDVGYLLENILDPSAVIPKEYAATKLDLSDGRVVTGIVKEETAVTLTVVTANETLTLPVKDIDRRTPSDLSMMPDDLLKSLSEASVRDLVAYLRHTQQVPALADAENAKDFFNGKDLTGWDGEKGLWAVENGEIVGKTATGLKQNTFLRSNFEVTDFKLSVKVKLTPNAENSGIQFRSVPIDGGEMRGPQADIGQGWWGKLYEESGRGLLVPDGGEKHVRVGDWNEYVVEATGPRVRIWINGEKVADYTDEKLARRGVIALQLHSGGPMEVRFKGLKLEVAAR